MARKAVWLVAAVLFALSGTAAAEEAGKGIVKTVADGCKKELETYCKDVTPGEGRVLACLYAYSDKLSSRCEFALYDAAVQLQRVVTALVYVANECDEDLDKFCSGVEPGGGRLAECLKKNEAKLSPRCVQAIKDVAGK